MQESKVEGTSLHKHVYVIILNSSNSQIGAEIALKPPTIFTNIGNYLCVCVCVCIIPDVHFRFRGWRSALKLQNLPVGSTYQTCVALMQDYILVE